MHGLLRSAVWMAFLGLAASVSGQVNVDYPDRYAQPQAGAADPQAGAIEQPQPAPGAPTPWPQAGPTAAAPPRVLPVQQAAQPLPRAAVPAPRSFDAVTVSAESNLPPQPIPLPQKTTDDGPLGPGDLPPVASTAASLGIVLGVFLLVAWVVRRGIPKGGGLLPSDAVEVLGRAPFIGRQQVHLVRCGNKIVLVTVTPSGTQTLTEITDPAEVERLLNLCQGGGAAGSARGWLGHFTHARSTDYRERPESLDFRNLDVGQTRS